MLIYKHNASYFTLLYFKIAAIYLLNNMASKEKKVQ